jgi:ribosomal protein S27AE
MPRRGKLDLERIRASLNTICPHCGHSITPAERMHVDTEHLQCPKCLKIFVAEVKVVPKLNLAAPGRHRQGDWRDKIFSALVFAHIPGAIQAALATGG